MPFWHTWKESDRSVKRILSAALLTALMILTLAGCGAPTSAPTAPTTTTTAAPAITTATALETTVTAATTLSAVTTTTTTATVSATTTTIAVATTKTTATTTTTTVAATTTTTVAATTATTVHTYPTDRTLSISFIGDSITEGGYWQNGLQGYLPTDKFKSKGFGVSGSTALKSGLEYDGTPFSYMSKTRYRRSLGSKPDIVVILLGTNDTRSFNWGQTGNENGELFIRDYVELVRSYQQLESHPQVFVVLPPRIHKDFYGINNQTLTAGVIPALYEVADQTGAVLVDAYTPTVNAAADFYDGVHPSTENGRKLIAKAVADAILEDMENAN